MAFNTDTYHANKRSREAREYLAEARALKARVAAGEERYRGEGDRLPFFVAMARSSARLARSHRAIRALSRKLG